MSESAWGRLPVNWELGTIAELFSSPKSSGLQDILKLIYSCGVSLLKLAMPSNSKYHPIMVNGGGNVANKRPRDIYCMSNSVFAAKQKAVHYLVALEL